MCVCVRVCVSVCVCGLADNSAKDEDEVAHLQFWEYFFNKLIMDILGAFFFTHFQPKRLPMRSDTCHEGAGSV